MSDMDEALAFMRRLTTLSAIRIMVPTTDWSKTRQELTDEIKQMGDPDALVLLGDESKLTDDIAEFVVRTPDENIITTLGERYA